MNEKVEMKGFEGGKGLFEIRSFTKFWVLFCNVTHVSGEKGGLLQYQKSRLVYSSMQPLDKSLVQGTVPDSAVIQV